MRGLMIVGLFLTLAVAVTQCQLVAQDQTPPVPEPEEKPYQPPPAWKSVEIGNFYFRRRSYRAALSRYQEAAKIDPSYALACLGMGKVYEKLGLRQKALENYRKYLDLLPSSKEAEEARNVQKAIAQLEEQLSRGKTPTLTTAKTPATAKP
jgi:tetratricopeptide (TPR) repeat protein